MIEIRYFVASAKVHVSTSVYTFYNLTILNCMNLKLYKMTYLWMF